MKFILGQKLGMSQIFDEKGNIAPVTLIEAGPCLITQLKTKDKDGYESVQLGFKKIKKAKRVKKPQTGKPFKYLREFRGKDREIGDGGQLKTGDKIEVSIFQEGDIVKVSGFSKGKGFAGVVKRWNFRGKRASHGTKHEERQRGSVGQRHPSRVVKGIKMPGRLGFERVSVKNLKVVKIDKENNLLAVKGAVPGTIGTLLEIRG